MSVWLLSPMGGKVAKVGKGTCVPMPGGFATFAPFPPLDLRGEIDEPTNRRPVMTEEEPFLVFGSVVEGPRKDVDDIDLVVPEFTDDRLYSAQVCLERYERLAEATGKPIDLFFTTYPEDFNLAAVYVPGQHWQ
jgi:hypothetical protein